MQQPAIAILIPNVLAGLGLKTLLGALLPEAEIALFQHFETFEAADPDRFVHYFVAVPAFVQHSAFFCARQRRTILLGRADGPQIAGLHRIDVYGSEEQLVRDILRLHRGAHPAGHAASDSGPLFSALSARETEVLALVARGLRNKEIAQRLHIGITTVISHRRNLMEKLGIKSAAGLTLYAVALGCVDTDEL